MRNFPNIEKSGFHKGQYAGYSHGRVYRIKKTNSSYGNWWAWRENDGFPGDAENKSLYAMTLESMSAKLAALPSQAKTKAKNDGTHSHAKTCARRVVSAAECDCFVSKLPA